MEHQELMDSQVIAKPKFRLQSDMKAFLFTLSIFGAAYLVLTLAAPEAETVSRYGLTLAQAQLVRVSFIIPYLFIWVTALVNVVWFRRYTTLVKGSTEESAFNKITKGLWMLFLVIVVPAFVTAIVNYFPSDISIQKSAVILRNYLTIAFYLVGFWYFWQASKNLLQNVHTASNQVNGKYQNIGVVAIATLAVIYTWAVLSNPFRTSSADHLVKATYYLPDMLIVFTVVIPYVLVWILGVLTVLNVLSYAKLVPGLIYRQTFSYLARGLALTIILLIGLQFLSQANAILGHAALSIILVIIYILFFAIAAGHVLIARGARKLAAIEEVK